MRIPIIVQPFNTYQAYLSENYHLGVHSLETFSPHTRNCLEDNGKIFVRNLISPNVVLDLHSFPNPIFSIKHRDPCFISNSVLRNTSKSFLITWPKTKQYRKPSIRIKSGRK